MHPALTDATEPLSPLQIWMDEALAAEPRVHNAAQLATVGADGRPHVRTILIKQVGAGGLVFYTNVNSRKGHDLAAHPHVSLVLHFKSLERQILIAGSATQVPDETADAYWAQRPRGSQISAWASRQSQPIEAPDDLQQRVAQARERFGEGPVPRPPFWTGFAVAPDEVEFWQGRPERLHDRVRFVRTGSAWARDRLYP
ncbi:MAG: pyridoxamine 5'-phosphate oxidase [Myxococcales bacterium]|nr:pyridoxamine 5'-phosphate oxidase [Myxococcales bacterium]